MKEFSYFDYLLSVFDIMFYFFCLLSKIGPERGFPDTFHIRLVSTAPCLSISSSSFHQNL